MIKSRTAIKRLSPAHTSAKGGGILQAFLKKCPWSILAAGAAIQILTGVPSAWGVFQKAVCEAYELAEADAAMIFSFVICFFGIGCILGGLLQDKAGPRAAGLSGAVLLGGGFCMAGWLVPAGIPWAFYLAFSVPVGLGCAFLYPSVMSCAQKWYAEKKGLATGVIGGAVGLLIASIGLNTSGLAAAGEDGSFINFSDKSVQLGLIGLAIALLLTYLKITVNGRTYKIKGALLISIVLTTIIGIPMGVTVLPENIFTRGALASIGNVAFQVDILGALKLSFVPFIIMLLINDFFGTLGTGLAMAGKAGLLDEDGNFPAFGKVFLVDSSATILGSLFGITTVSCFAESAAGVESGSRTGLSNLSTAFLFLLCMLFSPLFLMIPGAATGSALIVVGISMLETLRDVDFSGSEFLPVAVMLLVTAYKGDYVAGIALGMFTYLVVSVIRALVNRDAKYVPQWPAWVLGVLMVLYFIF